jgi:hypothetical protein
VVTFNAVTFDVDEVRYLTIGILGGFLGRFDRFAFHQKTREYEVLDDRDLWLLELRLDPAQRARLDLAIARGVQRWAPYSFFQRNCAYYLQAALAEATDAIPGPSGLVSPTGVFALLEASPLAGAAYHRPSASSRIAGLAAAVDPAFTAGLQRTDWQVLAADPAWISGLSSAERRLARELFALRSLQTATLLSPAVRAGLARLRLLEVESAATDGETPTPDGEPAADQGAGLPVPAPVFHQYSRFRLQYAPRPGTSGRIHLAFRAAMHDETEPWLGQQPASTMELLGLELSSPSSRLAPRLESAVLFSQRSLRPADWTARRPSWLLEVVGQRGGVYGPAATHLLARAGVGGTAQLPGGTYAHALVTVAAVGALREHAGLAPGIELGFVARASRGWRLGGTFTREHDLLAWGRHDQRLRLWTRLDVGARWAAVVTADLVHAASTVRLGVDWYP